MEAIMCRRSDFSRTGLRVLDHNQGSDRGLEGVRSLGAALGDETLLVGRICAQCWGFIGFRLQGTAALQVNVAFSGGMASAGRDGLRVRQGFPLRQGLRRTSRRTRPCRPYFSPGLTDLWDGTEPVPWSLNNFFMTAERSNRIAQVL